MKFSVAGFKTEEYENNHGMIMQEENLVDEAEFSKAKEAEKFAKTLFDNGADIIEIIHISGKNQSVKYWNPRVGISSTGVNWAEEFGAGLKI